MVGETLFLIFLTKCVILKGIPFIEGGNSMPNIGIPGLILVLIIALVIFGPSKLPQLGRAVGQTLKEFKTSTRDIINDEEKDDNKLEAKETQIEKK
jgi:sec-independent protein translocase protein TatA